MIVLEGENVNELYWQGLLHLKQHGERAASRNGPVLVAPTPVTSVYRRPAQRVLFNRARDANPFFHLMESLWMLAGKRDAAFLTRYAKQLGEYAEPNGMIHGAYGHRWRYHFKQDQLAVIANKLRTNPDDRQAVLQMWDGQSDLDFGGNEWMGDDLTGDWKDRPCNTHAYFRVRKVETVYPEPIVGGEGPFGTVASHGVLDMTVCCRSNDVIWGAYGANAVHFSVLQEYLAAAIGVQVGTYYQISNNFHAYDNDLWKRCVEGISDFTAYRYSGDVASAPMVTVPQKFLADCERFCEDVDTMWTIGDFDGRPYDNVWMSLTAWNMALAHFYHKKGETVLATRAVAAIQADDWRLACAEWIERRKK